MAKRLTIYILLGMVMGVLVGAVCHEFADQLGGAGKVAGYLKIPSDLFLRLIKMIIAPLVFSTLVLGIAQMGDTATLRRIGLRTLAWFLGASLLSLTLGLTMVTLFQPGAGLALPLPAAQPGAQFTAPSLNQFVVELAPSSIAKSMADNAVLQIVVFSLFAGVAINAVGERAAPLLRGISALADVMLQITNYVMSFAPIAVFAAIAAVVTTQGLSILVTYGAFVGEFYLSLVILWGLLLLAGSFVLGARIGQLVRCIREPLLIAFSTASSEASYPKTLSQLERFGVSNRIASFVLPVGYSFNLDGSMLYMTFATLFIAQAYGIQFSAAQLATLMLLLMVTSKGMAAVPRASLVVVAATLPFFNIPEAGLLLVLGIDQFLDMGRTATNVVGNAVATAVVAKWEGELEAPEAPHQEISQAPSEAVS
jgi:Na+/H+-dicarboxylate symporter